MKYQEIDLRKEFPSLPQWQYPCRLTAWLREISEHLGYGPEKQKHPVMIVVPGGGYSNTSPREADPIALQFFAANFHVFTLRYSCAPDRYPTALLQTAATILYVRQHAEELHADPDHIYVIGFSAGGHLAACSGILWKEPILSETLGVPSEMLKPNGMVLGYPVISWGAHAHTGSFHNLLGEDAAEEQCMALSLETRVDGDTVPAFIWHTFGDSGVPLENSLLLADALRKHDIPFELHIYPEGPHGLSTADGQSWVEGNDSLRQPHVTSWMPLCIDWLEKIMCRDLENWM